ncbi:long-chain fatty acid--CoA ligase [Campylobacter sp. MIT 12-8780]|uniref:ANL family adenylate-forming protein n=1 Tax=unclassified Campylobacter TaxID=2593542 RepID=UPI00115CE62F|nr:MULTISPECIES: fatty acid--CoA ligase family protein [unclassified Campylobacter]NDJ26471.1 long-chain fatty acid--CoA ligase [Campylobacter sp. MIT 19-121]TQR43041.1 long-chain fatty acid--CoA ligase [Campylobacter sp. MIT 12-8780]
MAEFKNAFLQKLLDFKENTALICDDEFISYDELLALVQDFVKSLQALKVKHIALVGNFDKQSIAMLLACLECSKIVALIHEEDKDFILKASEAQCDYIFKEGILKPFKEENSAKNQLFDRLKNEAGLIIFSSGTTGKPKVIVHNLTTLCASFLHKKPKKLCVLLFLMFDHIGGLNTLLNSLAMGACAVALKNRKDIKALALAIEKYKISLLPASVSLLNLMLLSGVKDEFDLSSLRMISYGTEKMPDSLLVRLKKVFKGVKFHQSFGTSEVGISQSKTYENAIKLENMDYKIINGELFLKSQTQSLGYLNADNSVFDEDGYFATGDLVELFYKDGEEFIKIIGRSKELINVGGEKCLPSEVEDILLSFEGIEDVLVYGASNALTGQSVTAKIVLHSRLKELPKSELRARIKAFCKDKLANYKIPSKFEFVDELELTNRGKKARA